MNVSKRGLAEIASHEGLVTSPYFDSVGVLTFGIGHTANAGGLDPRSLPMGKAQPLSLVMDVFEKDIQKFSKRVTRRFGPKKLKQHEHDGAASFDFNTGGIHKATWVTHFLNGHTAKAKAAFMNWRKPPEIIPRRRKELDLFFDGKYGSGAVSVFPADKRGRVLWGKGKRIKLKELMQTGREIKAPIANDDPMADGLLVLGEKGDPIAALCKELIELGFLDKQPKRKVYTANVQAAVKKAQKSFGLKADGIAGPKTFAAISKALKLDDDEPVEKAPEKSQANIVGLVALIGAGAFAVFDDVWEWIKGLF